MITRADFAHALLAKLNLPLSDNNVQAMIAFQGVEGGHDNTAWFNPMNTTQQMPGSHAFTSANKIGVQAYKDWDQGLEATAKTLNYGFYKNIIAALSRSAPAEETLNLIARSPWGGTGGWSPISSAASYQRFGSMPFRDAPSGGGTLGFPFGFTSLKSALTPTTKLGMVAVGVSIAFLIAIVIHEATQADRSA